MAAELSGASSAAHYQTVRSALTAAFDFAEINSDHARHGRSFGCFPVSCRDRRSALLCPGGGFRKSFAKSAPI